MDFNKYYLDQADGTPIFRGAPIQRGYGLGNAFRRFISWAIPYLKEYGLPVAKSVGKEIISNAASMANDALEGKDIKESANAKIRSSLEKLLPQKGKGVKQKRQRKSKEKSKIQKVKAKFKSSLDKLLTQRGGKRKRTRKLDVFDK